MPLAVNGHHVLVQQVLNMVFVDGSALDADTGAPAWKACSIPAPGEPGNDIGQRVMEIRWRFSMDYWFFWSKLVTILAYQSPGPDFDRHVRLGDNLFSNSTLVLDADSGKIKSYYAYTQTSSKTALMRTF